MGSYVFSAFQSQFPAWTLGALDIGYGLMLSGQQTEPPLSGWRGGSSWTTAPSQVTAVVNFVHLHELDVVAGLSKPSR